MIMVEFLVKIFSISQGSKMDAEYIDPYEINRPINIPEVFIDTIAMTLVKIEKFVTILITGLSASLICLRPIIDKIMGME